jgi:hypothetical protein
LSLFTRLWRCLEKLFVWLGCSCIVKLHDTQAARLVKES